MTNQVVGQSLKRLDAWDKVTGEAIYPGDRKYDRPLWLKVLFARRPHARITRIDTTAAAALPGVITILTAADVPQNEYGLQEPDQPVLCGPGSNKVGADVVRFVGDQVAVVVAETEQIAAAARALIEVDYEPLPVVGDAAAALQAEAPQLHPHRPGNLATEYNVVRGDVASAWARCDVIVVDTYHTPMQEHAYLQPEAGSACLDEAGRITVYTAGQWTWEDQQQIAHALDLPPERVRVVYDAIGGAFGGREDMSVQIILALAVQKLQGLGIERPVKIIWTREESIIGHCKRHAMTIRAKWGAKADGTLVAVEMDILSDGGAYMYTSNKVLANTVLTCSGPYHWPNARIRARAVYTNNLPGGAFRGFGAPQGHFAAENQMNKLAAALNLDPVEIRLKNALTDQTPLTVGTPIPGGVSMTTVIKETARAAGWRQPDGHWIAPSIDRSQTDPHLLRGIGFAAGFKNIGFSLGYPEQSSARIKLDGGLEIDKATVYLAGADVGQGHHTAMAQIAAETLGLAPDQVRLIVSDTAHTANSGSASASRLTMLAGNAVRGAAVAALKRWHAEERPAEAEYTWQAPETTPFDPQTGYSMPNFAYGYVAETAEVLVDTETGAITVQRVVCANDVGKAINPQQVTGQIEGAIVQAHGYALLEDFQVQGGQVLTSYLNTYLIPGVYDIPIQLQSIIVEDPHPDGPFGARGMAEMPYLPYAAAISAALYDATGVWFDRFPLTPERVLWGLGKLT